MIRLRAWRESDLPALTRLREDEAVMRQLMSRPKPHDVLEWLHRRTNDPAGAFFVVDCDGCVGFVQMTQIAGDEAYAGICIAPELQGRGLGRRALALLEAAARHRGIRTVKLQVLPTNSRAIALYESTGYARVSEGLMLRHFCAPAAQQVAET